MENEPVMTASDVGYDHMNTWIKSILGPVHATVRGTVAWALLCLLLAQRATPAALARALPAEQAGSGRACVRRVRRWWRGPPLEQACISPRLIHTALTALPPGTPVVVARRAGCVRGGGPRRRGGVVDSPSRGCRDGWS